MLKYKIIVFDFTVFQKQKKILKHIIIFWLGCQITAEQKKQ